MHRCASTARYGVDDEEGAEEIYHSMESLVVVSGMVVCFEFGVIEGAGTGHVLGVVHRQ